MKNGQRIRLIDDCLSRLGSFIYKKGQTGTVLFTCLSGNLVIDLDGYDDERKRAAEFKDEFGEAVNITIFIAEFQPEMLESV